MTVALEAAAAGWQVSLAGTTGHEDPEESRLVAGDAQVRVLRWPRPDKLAPPVRTGRRVLEALTRYPDRASGRDGARRLAAVRRQVAVRAAARRARGQRRTDRVVGAADTGLLVGRTVLHRLRWRATQRRTAAETSAQRALRHYGERAPAADLELGPRIEALRPDVVWAVGADTLRTAAGAVLRLRADGRPARLVYDAREDAALPADTSSAAQRLAARRARDEAQSLQAADAVVVPTVTLADRLRSRHPHAPAPVVVGDRPVPDSDEPVPPLRQRLGLAEDDDTLLLAVPDADRPGAVPQLTAVTETLTDVPEVRLVLLAGEPTPALRAVRDVAWSRGTGGRWNLLEGVAAGPAALAGADAVLVPVVDAAAAAVRLPRAYRSAVAAGLPVLAHPTPVVVADQRERGTGIVAELDDPRQVRPALRQLLRSREVLAARASRARDLEVAGSVAAVLAAVSGQLQVAPAPGRAVGSAAPARVREHRQDPERRVLGIGPANFAGQGWRWAKAAERAVPGLRTEVFAVDQGVLTFPADRRIRRRDLRALSWQLDQQHRVLTSYTHLLAEANRPLFGFLNGEDLRGDLPAVLRAGVVVGLALHGSEVRDPAAHRDRERWSPFREHDELFDQVSEFVARTRELLADFDGPVLVSTPDLLDDVPHGTWLPVVVDTDVPTGAEPLERDVPVVVHAPSRSRLKGTADIDDVLTALHEQGIVEYRRLGGVPPEQMPATLAAADVVLDQFAIGSYGVLACEAMAAGRVVVGHVRDDVRARVGEPLPIVEATPDDVADVLRELLADRDAARATARAGRDFVRRVHDGRRSGQVLLEELLSR